MTEACDHRDCDMEAAFRIKRYNLIEKREEWQGICHEHLEAELEAELVVLNDG